MYSMSCPRVPPIDVLQIFIPCDFFSRGHTRPVVVKPDLVLIPCLNTIVKSNSTCAGPGSGSAAPTARGRLPGRPCQCNFHTASSTARFPALWSRAHSIGSLRNCADVQWIHPGCCQCGSAHCLGLWHVLARPSVWVRSQIWRGMILCAYSGVWCWDRPGD